MTQRLKSYSIDPAIPVETPPQAAELLERYRDDEREIMLAIYLTPAWRAFHVKELAVGAMTEVIFEMADIFKEAVRRDGKFVILAHNHPYGAKAKPSALDTDVTRQVYEAGKIMKIPLLDHIVLTKDDHFSFRQADWWQWRYTSRGPRSPRSRCA